MPPRSASAQRSSRTMPAGRVRNVATGLNHSQPGDPARLAQALIDFADALMGVDKFLILLPKRSELDARSFANELGRALAKTHEGEPWTIRPGPSPCWRNELCEGGAASRHFALSGKASRTRPRGRIEVVASWRLTPWFNFLAEHAPALPVG
jgi:hypothetical protein